MNLSPATKVYFRLLRYVIRYWFPFLIGIIGLIVHSLAEIAFIDLLRFMTDTIAVVTDTANESNRQSSGLVESFTASIFGETIASIKWLAIPLMLILISAIRGVGYLIGTYCLAVVSNYLVHSLRVRLFNSYLYLPFSYYDKSMSGNLISTVTFNVQQVTEAGTKALKTLLQQGSLVIGLLAYLIYTNWILTLFFICVLPLIGFIVNKVSLRFRRISKNIQSAMGEVTHVTQEAVNGYNEIRMYGAVRSEKRKMSQASHHNRRQNMKMAFTSALSNPLIIFIVSIAFAGVTGFMLNPYILNTLTAGSFIAFIVASGVLIKPIRQLTEINSDIQRGIAAAESIFAVIDTAGEPDEGIHKQDVVEGDIDFCDVSFKYDSNDQKVLKNISLSVKAGETIAIVGSSGSGKTSLVNLIPRFYDCSEGKILLDGIDTKKFTLENLRTHISLVSQNVTLFNDSVINNIAFGELKDRERERIINAAKIANAHDFIESLPEGYNTEIGDDGVLLSGGQRQRIAIARAILKNAPILILDEATSALDSDSERQIQKALEELIKDRTSFVIAHRLSTIEKADRILVIEKGEVVEEGSHASLLAANGRYASLYNNDFEEIKDT
ncbi:MAG: lipid A export permease/ATP-binding protein MsbA [Pseudomonadota bacterium]|nr:lipid A export permease/ATP-binding protein MsbA [Pseudomonadota bacterium]MEC8469721.1 lipid A export permease/ATP-binding protein MsbA [Pseudomonadota bacterium]